MSNKEKRIIRRYRPSFEDWKANLPPNLQQTDTTLYNLKGAYEAGLEPEYNKEDNSYHLGSRNPKTGEILKSYRHPTFNIALLEDAQLGYYPYNKNGKLYTDTWEGNKDSIEDIARRSKKYNDPNRLDYLQHQRVKDLSKADDETWDNINASIYRSKELGLNDTQAAGIAANMYIESRAKNVNQIGGPAKGYFQLEEATYKNYKAWLKKNNLEDNAANATEYMVRVFDTAESVQDKYNNYYLPEYKKAKTKDDKNAVNDKYATLRKLQRRKLYNGKSAKDFRQMFDVEDTDSTTTAFLSLAEVAGKPHLEARKAVAKYILDTRYND